MSALHLVVNGDGGRRHSNGRHARNGSGDHRHREFLERVARLSIRDDEDTYTSAGSEYRSSLAASPPPFSGDDSSSVTSFNFDRNSDILASGSETPSDARLSPAPSLYSLTSSIREESTRIEFGRGVNTHSEIYRLAADEDEAKRLDQQHEMFKRIMGDYVPPMREVLADNDDPLDPKTCLDIGCGSGAWAVDVARDFPHVSCVAVDLVPMPAIDDMPPNLRFEIDDVNLGLEHYEGDFDVVHARLVSSGIRDYFRLVHDTARALRPRGLADFMEFDFRIYDLAKRPITPTTREIWGNIDPPDGWTGTGMGRVGGGPSRSNGSRASAAKRPPAPPSPFLARWFTLAGQAARKRGANVDAAALLHRWISEHRDFEDVRYREFWLPASSWMRQKGVRQQPEFRAMSNSDFETRCWVGDLMGIDIAEFLRSGRPLLLSTGVALSVVDHLESNAMREIREARIPMYARVQNVYARKRVRQQPPPPPPQLYAMTRSAPSGSSRRGGPLLSAQ